MSAREKVTCIASGAEAYFDRVGHTYIDADGAKYISGSTYAGLFGYEFDKKMALPKAAEKLKIKEHEVDAYWNSKGEISTTFGTALHAALEYYGKYKDVIARDIDSKTGKPKGTGIHPTIEPIVLDFFKGREKESALYEAFVADELNLRCGFIDRLVITGPKRCIIEDFKTNGDLYKKHEPTYLKTPHEYLENTPYGKYTLQLSFYQEILEAAGWVVEDRLLHWWNGTAWVPIQTKKVDASVMPILAPEFA